MIHYSQFFNIGYADGTPLSFTPIKILISFAQSVKHGGVEEYEAVLKLFEAGKNPSVHQASMYVYLRLLHFFMNRRLIAVVVQARSRRDARPEAD